MEFRAKQNDSKGSGGKWRVRECPGLEINKSW